MLLEFLVEIPEVPEAQSLVTSASISHGKWKNRDFFFRKSHGFPRYMAAPEGEAIHLLAVAAATKRLSLPDFRGEGGGLGSQE